jgi:hypothetical protein
MQRGVGTGDPETTETIQLGPCWTGALLSGADRAGRYVKPNNGGGELVSTG